MRPVRCRATARALRAHWRRRGRVDRIGRDEESRRADRPPARPRPRANDARQRGRRDEREGAREDAPVIEIELELHHDGAERRDEQRDRAPDASATARTQAPEQRQREQRDRQQGDDRTPRVVAVGHLLEPLGQRRDPALVNEVVPIGPDEDVLGRGQRAVRREIDEQHGRQDAGAGAEPCEHAERGQPAPMAALHGGRDGDQHEQGGLGGFITTGHGAGQETGHEPRETAGAAAAHHRPEACDRGERTRQLALRRIPVVVEAVVEDVREDDTRPAEALGRAAACRPGDLGAQHTDKRSRQELESADAHHGVAEERNGKNVQEEDAWGLLLERVKVGNGPALEPLAADVRIEALIAAEGESQGERSERDSRGAEREVDRRASPTLQRATKGHG